MKLGILDYQGIRHELLSRGFILKALCCEIMPLLMLALGSH
jgi:hypothetical protein